VTAVNTDNTFAAICVDDGFLIYVNSLLYSLIEGGTPFVPTFISWNTWWNGCPRIDNKCDKVEMLLTEKLVELDGRCVKAEVTVRFYYTFARAWEFVEWSR
jgi:hypothetical protein